MNAITFIGWVGDDALKVIKSHVPKALDGIDSSKDPATMQAYVIKMKEQIRASKFKSLNVKVVGGTYILHLGKCIEISANETFKEIPIELIEGRINYVSLIKEDKIRRTKYPTLYTMMINESVHKSETPAQPTQKPKYVEDDDDSLDRTEAVNNIIKKKPSAEVPTPEKTEKTEKAEKAEKSEKSEKSEKAEKPKKETENKVEADKDDIEYSNVEVEVGDDFFDGDKKSVKFDIEDEVEETVPVKPIPVKEEPISVSRKQRRKQMVDPDEESRWEKL